MYSTREEFPKRHIGPRQTDIRLMLQDLGFASLEDMAKKVIPQAITSSHSFSELGEGLSEHEMLVELREMLAENKVLDSCLGQGYHDTITPPVIQRNILENPVWYTAYTPYQPEISQGRMEALLNFQTLVSDLTGLPIANASLLDEGTAAAEALAMAHNLTKNKAQHFLLSPDLHPHVKAVVRTRAEPQGLTAIEVNPDQFDFKTPIFAMILSYPTTDGRIEDYQAWTAKAHQQGALVIVDTDLLALTLLTPPGEWGADIVVGNSQRFGVPLGNGGPHAAFMSTLDANKRLLPGRLVGVSVDSMGKPALRLTLQTREQHIRREKATSNICTAQVLLANMASMYAVYHGPEGLKAIAQRIHGLTNSLQKGLQLLGYSLPHTTVFDTVRIDNVAADKVLAAAEDAGFNLRRLSATSVGISLHEKTTPAKVEALLSVFAHLKGLPNLLWKEVESVENQLPPGLRRKSAYLTHPVFQSHHSEHEILRYIHMLQNKDLTLTHSMIPLGSCTMKLNATAELVPVSWPEVSGLHPLAPLNQMRGSLKMIHHLEQQLCAITGFAAVTLQPNAGSQGEYSGLLVIREYHKSRGQSQRTICLIPSSAHGTNPATAVMAGMEVVVVKCDEQGNVDVADLRAKAEQHRDRLAALMITYPSTHGVFEEAISEICQIIHANGGQVYMDGANLNALVAICRPGEFGPDVSHMNLHKTFAIPHGGGGPGVGPIGVAKHLKDFLPTHPDHPECGPRTGIGPVSSAPWGSASILPISWAYIRMMGAAGLRQATLVSILNANYVAHKLEAHYPILYKGRNGLVAHECILDLRVLKKETGIEVNDVAKRLMDYGFHSPTMSWPVIGTLMVEPTESEPKAELDRFVEAMIGIAKEAQLVKTGKWPADNNPLVHAPHTAWSLAAPEWNHPYSRETAAYPAPWTRNGKYWPTVGRVDNAYGDRNVMCVCPPLETYQ